MTSVRVDIWLWAARFFKTRSLAKRACEIGRVEAGGHTVKPARDVHVGDKLRVTTDSGIFEIEVLELSEMRGPAPIAQTLYRETEESKDARQRAAEVRKLMPYEPAPLTRPSKRDRRRIVQFRNRG
jgi:ribosome-associated heat shock protein Hsp15